MNPSMMSDPGFDLFFWVIFLVVFGLLLPVLLLWSARGRQKQRWDTPQQSHAQPHESWPAYEQGYQTPQQTQQAEPEGEPMPFFPSERVEPPYSEQNEIEMVQRQ